MSNSQTISAAASGTLTIGGDLLVNRMGFGAMRITGAGIWGPPADKAAAVATLRRTIELGVNLIDTADSYGPGVSEELIAEALYPYPAGLVIATKGGWERPGPGQWTHNASPEHLTEALEGSLKRLRVDRIDIHQLHAPDNAVSFEASVEALAKLREQGKIRHVALSNVTREHIERARRIVPIVSVQNRYSFADRESDFIVDYCEQNGIAFLPWAPLGQVRETHTAIKKVADELHATSLQVALAWLLKRSKVIVPIPGTSSVTHLEENIAAAGLTVPQAVYDRLSAVSRPPASLRDFTKLSAPVTMEEVERAHILQILERTGGTVGGLNGAAARLGMPRTTLISKMTRLGMDRGSALANGISRVAEPVRRKRGNRKLKESHEGIECEDSAMPRPIAAR